MYTVARDTAWEGAPHAVQHYFRRGMSLCAENVSGHRKPLWGWLDAMILESPNQCFHAPVVGKESGHSDAGKLTLQVPVSGHTNPEQEDPR